MNVGFVTLDEMAASAEASRQRGRRIVLCHGEFDLVHKGHLERLASARQEGELLFVAIVADEDCVEAPTLTAELRGRTVAALGGVHAVAVVSGGASVALQRIRPDVFVPAMDAHDRHRAAAADMDVGLLTEAGARVYLLPDSLFRQRVIDERPDPLRSSSEAFLRDFKRRWNPEQIISLLQGLRGQRVLVIGDTILDEYHFCRPYGMPLKSPIIAAQSLGSEMYAGGVLAVANHLANFCERVDLLTVLGNEPSNEGFIRRHLHNGVVPKFFFRDGAPTTVKRRYVQKFLLRKLFEISYFDDRQLPDEVADEVDQWLRATLAGYDLVVVADFGHGMMTPTLIGTVCSQSRFLALNTQLNSVNFGYHHVGKYPRADYVCIDEEEMRLATFDRTTPIVQTMPLLADRMRARAFTVTRGHHGSLTWVEGGELVSVPVLSREVVDTIGAGDAYLSVTAPCVAAGFPTEVVGFVGNCVGALAVRIVGNQHAVQQESLFDFIRGVMR